MIMYNLDACFKKMQFLNYKNKYIKKSLFLYIKQSCVS